MATKTPQVIGGVDTHRDLHVAAAIDPVGRVLGHRSFVATPAGYRAAGLAAGPGSAPAG